MTRLRRLAAATRLVMLVQARAYFPQFFAVFVVLVIAALLWLFPEEVALLVLPAFLVSEPGILGLTFVAAYRYLELDAGVGAALLVSPLRSSEYLLAVLLGSALLATVAGGVTFAAVAGLDARLGWMLPVLFAFALLSGLLGFGLSMRYADFPRFILGTIPAVVVWQAPLLAVYDVVPTAAVAWIPSAPAILGIAALCGVDAGTGRLLGLTAAGAALSAVGFGWVHRIYAGRLRAGLEAT